MRGPLQDPDTGLIGCVGAVGVRSIAWWEASVTCASFINRYEEHGGGDLESFSWAWTEAPAYARIGQVETLDGFVLVLSPWVVRNIRFDEELGTFHGYDLDFCLQVRDAGRKVVTADFRAVHHRPLEMVPDPAEWIDAHVRVARQVGRPDGHRRRRRHVDRACPAGRGRGGRRPYARLHARARVRRPGPRASRRVGRDHAEHLVADHRPAPVARASGRGGPAVIAFGSAIGGAEAYRRYAEPGVRLASEPDSEVFAFAAVDSTARSYNLILDAAAARDELEALVLVHPHTEIVDPAFCAKVRAALADPEVGVAGCAGANRVRSIAWWEGTVISSAATQRYQEYGGGELPAISWARHRPPPAEVEVLDGQLLVLSPWVVRNLRFDEDVLDHGFDVDFSLRVAGGRPQAARRRLAGPPPPIARADRRPGAVDRGSHPDGREVGRGAGPVSGRRTGLEGTRAVRRSQARGGQGDAHSPKTSGSTPGCSSSNGRWRRRPTACRGG